MCSFQVLTDSVRSASQTLGNPVFKMATWWCVSPPQDSHGTAAHWLQKVEPSPWSKALVLVQRVPRVNLDKTHTSSALAGFRPVSNCILIGKSNGFPRAASIERKLSVAACRENLQDTRWEAPRSSWVVTLSRVLKDLGKGQSEDPVGSRTPSPAPLSPMFQTPNLQKETLELESLGNVASKNQTGLSTD